MEWHGYEFFLEAAHEECQILSDMYARVTLTLVPLILVMTAP